MDYCFEFSIVQLIFVFVLFIFSITTTTLTIIIISCVYVYDCLSEVPIEARRRCQNSWNWLYRRLWVAQCGCWDPNLGLLQNCNELLFSHYLLSLPVVIFWGVGWPQTHDFFQPCCLGCWHCRHTILIPSLFFIVVVLVIWGLLVLLSNMRIYPCQLLLPTLVSLRLLRNGK